MPFTDLYYGISNAKLVWSHACSYWRVLNKGKYNDYIPVANHRCVKEGNSPQEISASLKQRGLHLFCWPWYGIELTSVMSYDPLPVIVKFQVSLLFVWAPLTSFWCCKILLTGNRWRFQFLSLEKFSSKFTGEKWVNCLLCQSDISKSNVTFHFKMSTGNKTFQIDILTYCHF